MEFSNLNALSPLDGRYAEKISPLKTLFSELGLFHHRYLIEMYWLKSLADNPKIPEVQAFDASTQKKFETLLAFSKEDAEKIKQIEETTRHDVKAVEYFIKEKFQAYPEFKKLSEFIHFGCTSDDINNLAYALALKKAREQYLSPLMHQIISRLTQWAHLTAEIPMLSRTHGQPATPTTAGKEFANFVARLKKAKQQFDRVIIDGKFNGAVGNFNAYHVAYPEVDWLSHVKQFVESFGISFNAYTTQIEPHDWIANYCDALARFNTILIDFNRDMWGYISLGYFKQKIKEHEVGSSTMPHKVNPIHFENSEGNLGLANALLNHFSSCLPISRWQRDLSDSTRLRNLGVALGHAFLAYQSCKTGVEGLDIEKEIILSDLNNHFEILTEAIQTVMRRYGIEQGYEQLKSLTRAKKVNPEALASFIQKLDLPAKIKASLLELKPSTYVGYATQLAREIDEHE